ncbi:MAG: phage baseplate assembly protein V [Butyrivibrio sp.]|nr:phage baseplate assembly protein V [Acetatifactor muris]MCM1560012.1 phage baseplate assembly protein V [Butyrivibrio sp.]
MISDYLEEREAPAEGMRPTYDVWGTVLAAGDNTSKGNVRVRVKVMKDNMDTFDDVPVLTCYGGGDYGAYCLPEEGDTVRLTFLGGDFRHPVVTGCRFPESSGFVADACQEKNLNKVFRLKNGSRIALSGEKGEEKLEVAGPEQMEWVLDEKNRQTAFGDREKKNRLLLDKKEGKALIKAEKVIRLECGDSSLELKENGTVVLNCKQLTLEAKNVKISGKAKVQLEGQELAMQGTTSASLSCKGQVKVEGRGALKLSGAMIHLN